jgi:subtilisin family serine protease
MEKEYVVTLRRGESWEDFSKEMVDEYGSDVVPSRPVIMTNSRPVNKRNTHFMLTEEEAEELKKDPRVIDVDVPADQNEKVGIGLRDSQKGDFNRFGGSKYHPNKINWGLVRCINSSNPYSGRRAVKYNYEYDLDGTGVDVVIHDSGIQADHPEFDDVSGVSRVQQIDWYKESGVHGRMPNGHYTDYNGHGTHVAATAVGKTYGWAKNAKIYAIKVNGLQGRRDPNGGIPIVDCFDVIKGWHERKPVDPKTGKKRPTIVNMSWGYSANYKKIKNISYRGRNQKNTWNIMKNLQSKYGLIPLYNGQSYITNSRMPAIDADIQELIDAGIHVCIAAGNNGHKIDVPNGADYNNYIDTDNGRIWYHRGSSPYDDEAFIVGNVDSRLHRKGEAKIGSSECGPGVNIWAPGTDIMSACSTVNDMGNGVGAYPKNRRFKIVSITGTSMASPQICGMGAIILQMFPELTPKELRDWFDKNAKAVLFTTGRDNDYNNNKSLLGSPNKIAYNESKEEFVGKNHGKSN